MQKTLKSEEERSGRGEPSGRCLWFLNKYFRNLMTDNLIQNLIQVSPAQLTGYDKPGEALTEKHMDTFIG